MCDVREGFERPCSTTGSRLRMAALTFGFLSLFFCGCVKIKGSLFNPLSEVEPLRCTICWLQMRFIPCRCSLWRMIRIVGCGPRVLFHTTSLPSAMCIVATQRFLRGSRGTSGAGIYFADTPVASQWKAQRAGVTLVALVWPGCARTTTHTTGDEDFLSLECEGIDSVRAVYMNGDETIVYNYDQAFPIVPALWSCCLPRTRACGTGCAARLLWTIVGGLTLLLQVAGVALTVGWLIVQWLGLKGEFESFNARE